VGVGSSTIDLAESKIHKLKPALLERGSQPGIERFIGKGVYTCKDFIITSIEPCADFF
jgi:hypothetical protein